MKELHVLHDGSRWRIVGKRGRNVVTVRLWSPLSAMPREIEAVYSNENDACEALRAIREGRLRYRL